MLGLFGRGLRHISLYRITPHEVIIARALNFKMAALQFVIVFEKVINAMDENSIPKSTDDAIEFGQ